MSIDRSPLPAFLYADLFGKNLVNLRTDAPTTTLKDAKTIDFLGGNEKQISILFTDSQYKFLGDIQMKFLNDLLTACHLTMADVALVNIFHHHSVSYRELQAGLQPKKILMFGISAGTLDLPFTIPFFQMQNFQEQVYMISPSIEELQMNIELRKQLWACLQKIFNIQKQK